MNPLLQDLPTAVEVAGVEYPINSGFRTCLTCILVWEDAALTDGEKTRLMLDLMYPTVPLQEDEAAEMAVLFLNGGEASDTGDTGDGCGGDGRLFSFAQDAQYIYVAIKQQYGVDLNNEPNLHWWKFCYMFSDLPAECFFQRMIALRRGYKRGKLTKEEREAYAALREVLDLPEAVSGEEQGAEDEFMRLLREGEQK